MLSDELRDSCSIVVTIFNEKDVCGYFFDELINFVNEFNNSNNEAQIMKINEVIFVDGGSNDGTVDLINQRVLNVNRELTNLKFRLITQPASTKLAFAEWLGIKSATGNFVIKMDGDLQHDPKFIRPMINIALNFDLVIASRYVKGGGNLWKPFRGIVSRIAKFEAMLFLPPLRKVKDPLSGFYLLRKEILPLQTPENDSYKELMTILSLKRPLRIAEVPYVMVEREKGSSKLTSSLTSLTLNFNREIISNFVSYIKSDSCNIGGQKEKEKTTWAVVSRSSFLPNNDQGGADKHALKLAISLKKTVPNDNVVFVGRNYPQLNQVGVRLLEIKSPRSLITKNAFSYFLNGFVLNLISAITAIKYLRKISGNKVVNAHSNIAAILISLFSKETSIIFRMHDPLFSKLDHEKLPVKLIRVVNNLILERTAIRVSDFVISTSPKTFHQIPDFYKVKSDQIFAPVEEMELIDRNNHEIASLRNLHFEYVISIGYQNGRKRFDFLIRAWENVDPKLHLVLAGNGPMADSLKKLAREHNLSDRVHFLGYVPSKELIAIIQNAKIGILASERETFPTTIIECLRAGTPSLYLTRDPLRFYAQLISDYLFISNDWKEETLAEQINRFYSKTYELSPYEVMSWANKTFKAVDLGKHNISIAGNSFGSDMKLR